MMESHRCLCTESKVRKAMADTGSLSQVPQPAVVELNKEMTLLSKQEHLVKSSGYINQIGFSYVECDSISRMDLQYNRNDKSRWDCG